jgi:O-antigen ligase
MTIANSSPRLNNSTASLHHVPWVPPRALEYGYFLTVAYSITSTNLGIEIPLFAAGMLVLLAGICIYEAGRDIMALSRPIHLLLAALFSFIGVQIVFHNSSFFDQIIRNFILWFCGMIILQSLRLRPGFLHRCTIVLLFLGLTAMPYLIYGDGGSVERARSQFEGGGNLSHPNGMAGWFGFCAVSLVIFGNQAKRPIHRGVYWLTAIACLLIVGLTVSRGALIAAALALVVVFRRLLKRGFLPVLSLLIIASVAIQIGLFDTIMSSYDTRGLEETGRFLLWPHVITRILGAPFVGVGANDIDTYIAEIGEAISTPHNSFLYFALASGIVPFLCWLYFWLRSGWKAIFGSSHGDGDESMFQLPLLVYIFVHSMLGDINSDPWVLLCLSVGAGSAVVYVKTKRVSLRASLVDDKGPRLRGRRSVTHP